MPTPSSQSPATSLLDPGLNQAPAKTHHIHIMGICGTGMAALAGMLKEGGFLVTGSDQHVYPPMSTFLAGLGIPIMTGYRAENLVPTPDLVVVGNVITRVNPEAVALAATRLPYLSFPQALAHFFLQGKTPLVVTGTHGKTTTASLLASILHGAGRDPGFLIGGLLQGFSRNFRHGAGQEFVVEGDEYDTAFFDKGPKFLHYRPEIAVITSIEFDHADIYADLAAVISSFRKLLAIMPATGCLVACLDDPVVRDLVQEAPCPVLGYGEGPGLDWTLAELENAAAATSFTVLKNGKEYGRFSSPMPGRHNGLNVLATLAVLDRLGVDRQIMARELARFQGVKRRQEVRGVVAQVTVIDDFAHHPTAVAETLTALRGKYAGHRLIVVFDPRTNSSRRRVFQQAYVSAFDPANLVIIREPEPLAAVPAAERFSARQLVADLCQRGVAAHYGADTNAILAQLAGLATAGDVVAILSNGGFDNIHQRLLEILSAKDQTTERPPES